MSRRDGIILGTGMDWIEIQDHSMLNIYKGLAMKYQTEIVINKPREEVIALFDNIENMSKWMVGLKSFEAISGEPGQPGAKSQLVFEQNGRTIEMVETITKRNFPDEFSGTYETKGVMNWVNNYFHAEGDKTRWVSENVFEFSGFMKVLAFFMKGAFSKQSNEYMKNFKKFAEGEEITAS